MMERGFGGLMFGAFHRSRRWWLRGRSEAYSEAIKTAAIV